MYGRAVHGRHAVLGRAVRGHHAVHLSVGVSLLSYAEQHASRNRMLDRNDGWLHGIGRDNVFTPTETQHAYGVWRLHAGKRKHIISRSFLSITTHTEGSRGLVRAVACWCCCRFACSLMYALMNNARLLNKGNRWRLQRYRYAHRTYV